MDMTFWKPVIAGQVRHFVGIAAGALLGVGAISSSQGAQFTEIASGIVMWALVAVWSWWQHSGQAQASAMLRKLTSKSSTAAAVAAAEVLPTGAAVTPGAPKPAVAKRADAAAQEADHA